MKYTVDYFIKKFTAIPNRLWHTGTIIKDSEGRTCALGHCGGYNTTESKALNNHFRTAFDVTADCVNDNDYDGKSLKSGRLPKNRILNALELIKMGVKV